MTESADLTPSREALAGLGHWADVLAAPGIDFGTWVTSEPRPDGVIQMPYVELGADGLRFLRDVGSLGLVVPFDWRRWLSGPDGSAYREDRTRIAAAPPDDVTRLLTSIVRSDRFNEGELLDAFETGLLATIAARARDLAGPDPAAASGDRA